MAAGAIANDEESNPPVVTISPSAPNNLSSSHLEKLDDREDTNGHMNGLSPWPASFTLSAVSTESEAEYNEEEVSGGVGASEETDEAEMSLDRELQELTEAEDVDQDIFMSTRASPQLIEPDIFTLVSGGYLSAAQISAAEMGERFDVNAYNSEGYTALMLAAKHGHLDVMRWLGLELAADTALLKQLGATPKKDDGRTALTLATANGQMEVSASFID